MRNRRLMFQAFSVLMLGVALLFSGSARAVGEASQGCFVCNYGCPDANVREIACQERCGSGSQGRGCVPGCDGGDTYWLCENPT